MIYASTCLVFGRVRDGFLPWIQDAKQPPQGMTSAGASQNTAHTLGWHHCSVHSSCVLHELCAASLLVISLALTTSVVISLVSGRSFLLQADTYEIAMRVYVAACDGDAALLRKLIGESTELATEEVDETVRGLEALHTA